MLLSIRQTTLFALTMCTAAGFSSACSESKVTPLEEEASAAEGDDASAEEDSDSGSGDDPGEQEPDETDPGEPDEIDPGEGDPEQDAGAEEPDSGAELDAAEVIDETDAGDSVTDPDAGAPEAGESDAGLDASALDAGQGDAGRDASAPEAGQGGADAAADGGCPAAQPADSCGVCGGDGASCRHPLAGHYAARTQFYAHQKASIEGTDDLDLISKGALLSVVDIAANGIASEHYCFLEIVSPEDIFIWSSPDAVQEIPDTAIQLEQRAGRFVRPLAAHQGYFGWSPAAEPADCVAGQMHASGCSCAADELLPTSEDDCRVLDIDSDGLPGGSMYLDFAQAADPSVGSMLLKLNIVALLNLEWNLGPLAGGRSVGTIAGGLEQAVLSLEGSLGTSVGALDNTMCPSESGHVELVRGDFTCASILAGRATDNASYGIFDVALDAAPPTLAACPGPGM
jgi:hypothetical protein